MTLFKAGSILIASMFFVSALAFAALLAWAGWWG